LPVREPDLKRLLPFAAVALTATPAFAASSRSGDDMGLVILAIAVVVVVFYFLPTIVAARRGHHNALAIFVLNLLGGWMGGVGWVLALVWACTAVKRRDADGLID
jgi:predicted PurR-regulated permease PerM